MSSYDMKQVINFVKHLSILDSRKIEHWHCTSKSLVIVYTGGGYFEIKKCIPLAKIIKERSA